MIKYPDGREYSPNKTKQKLTKFEISISSSNRGMSFEEDINISNEYYSTHGVALITKRPTPINVVHVDYTNGPHITDAYFEQQSTTDYNGIYREKYIDFEAKSTKSKTSFPLANISHHQIEHLKEVVKYGGIGFFIINFEKYDETYILSAEQLISFMQLNKRKSIPYQYFKEKAMSVTHGYYPRLYYLEAVDELFF
ncbi:MAG: Holliday junction resolvase RecU [Bacilli bacterium]|nr:Holliday junction resolvase RecU [Bacilli bacterium]